MIPQVHSEIERIKNIFFLGSSLPPDEEHLSHWSKYLCILTSGLIELSIKKILGEYSKRNSSIQVSNYVSGNIDRVSNLNSERLKQLLGKFNSDWARDFENAVTEEQIDAIDSIVANRHLLSHGRSVGISFIRMKQYFKNVEAVVNWIHDKILV